MIRINKHFSSLVIAICSGLISLLGFSCSSSEEVMYGMPTGDFEIKGSVTTEDGQPVENAEVRVTHPDVESGVYSFKKVSTDAKGNYNLESDIILGRVKVVCIPKNPDMQSDSVIVKLEYKGSHDDWDAGHAEETVDFKLKENKQAE